MLEIIERIVREVPEVDIDINGEDYPLSSGLETHAMGKILNKNKKQAVSRRNWSDSELGVPPIVFSIARRDGFVDIRCHKIACGNDLGASS